MASLDPRLIRVTITLDGKSYTFDQSFAITATGTKYANELQNEAEVTIYNLDRATQDFILTKTSPYNLDTTEKTVTIEAGRVSYGLAQIFIGNIILASLSQPPDIGVSLRCLTGNFNKGNIVTINQAGTVAVSLVAKQAAENMKLLSNFQATDKLITNASYSGPVTKVMASLNTVGGIVAFIDDNVLVVKNAVVPLNGSMKLLSAETGMIGIPEFTEQGIRVKFLLDNRTTLGGGLRIDSKVYPAINGDYDIYKLSFDLASRDTPFYYIAEAARVLGTTANV